MNLRPSQANHGRALILAAMGFMASASALHAANLTLTESDWPSSLTVAQTCNSISTLGSLAPQKLVSSSPVAGTLSEIIANGSTQEVVFYSASGIPNATSWPAGNWVVNLSVTTGSTYVAWQDTCIIRVDSSGNALATVGSLTAQNIALSSTGVQSMTISGSAQSASATDRIAVVINLQNTKKGGGTPVVAFDAGNTTNDILTTPFTSSGAYNVSLTETLSQSDSIARVAGFGRGVTDAPTTSDSVAKSEGFPVTLAESESLSDSIAQQFGYAVALAESEAVSDSLGQQSAYSRSPSETLAETDSLSRLAALGRGLGESESVSDSLGQQLGVAVALAESEAVSDSLAQQLGVAVALAESEAVSDSLGQQSAYMRTNSEALAQSDSLVRQAAFGRAALEAETLADSLASLYRSGAEARPLNGARLSPGSSGATLSGQGSGTRLAPQGHGAALGAHGSGTVLRNPQ